MPLPTEIPVVPIAPIPAVPPPAPVDTASTYSDLTFNSKIISYIDGTPWTVTAYYSQFLGNDDVIVNSNDVTNPTLRQYVKINNAELRQTQPLASSIDASTGTSTVTGEANVYPVMTPTPGDVFIAGVESGVLGVFEVTGIERSSLFKLSAWKITYSQISYVGLTTIADYDQYVVDEVTFDVNRMRKGENPFFTSSEYVQNINKVKLLNDLISNFYIEFYHNKSKTFLVPNSDGLKTRYYDPFIIQLWNTLVSAEVYAERPAPLEYSMTSAYSESPYITVVDALLKQSPTLLRSVQKRMSGMTTGHFSVPFQRHTLLMTGIDYVIIPLPEGLSVNAPQDIINPDTQESILDLYIFSNGFYTGDLAAQTPIELQLTKLLNTQAVAFSDVLPIVNTIPNVSNVCRFYYVPFLILLLLVCR